MSENKIATRVMNLGTDLEILESKNPQLYKNELCIAKITTYTDDTKTTVESVRYKIKVGDGQHNFNDLPYIYGELDEDYVAALVDQTYNAESENAQSGKAVAEAVSGYVKKVKGNGHTYQVYAAGDLDDAYNDITLAVENNNLFEYGADYGKIPYRQSNGNLMTNAPVKNLDCANKQYVDDAVSASLTRIIVTELPTEDINTNAIYMLALSNDDSEENNIYEEYLYINSKWELIGTTKVDLSPYALNTDVDAINKALNNLADKDLIINNPSASIQLSVNGGTTYSNNSVLEVGSEYTLDAKLTFTPGYYKYSVDDSGNVSETSKAPTNVKSNGYILKTNIKDSDNLTVFNYNETGEKTNASVDSAVTVKVMSESRVIEDNEVATLSLNVSYDDGDVPYNDLGLQYASKQILAGSVNATSRTVKSYRKPFWGYKTDKNLNPSSITSSDIRSLGNNCGYSNKECTTKVNGTSVNNLPSYLKVPAGTYQVYIAVKANTKSSLTISNITKEPATGVACTKLTNIMVDDKREAGDNLTAYDVWYINLPSAFTAETILSLTWK